MPTLVYKTLWGVDGLNESTIDDTFARIKADGFDGIEFCVGPFFESYGTPKAKFIAAAQAHGLQLIAQIHTCSIPCTSYKLHDHVASFEALVKEAATFAPVLINSHSGKDSFTLNEAKTFFQFAVAVEKKLHTPIPIVHETHRQRILYSAVHYRDLMHAGCFPPELRLNADISHWQVVAERLLDDERDGDFWPAVLADVAARAALIHCRVGFEQGPQVQDPTDPFFKTEVDAHFRWWKIIVEGMRARHRRQGGSGDAVVRLEPEHGGAPYLWNAPHTKKPLVADLWAVNTALQKKLRAAFE